MFQSNSDGIFASTGKRDLIIKGTETMQRARSEKQVIRQQQQTLASQYRAIGPAAILAALIYATRKPCKTSGRLPHAA